MSAILLLVLVSTPIAATILGAIGERSRTARGVFVAATSLTAGASVALSARVRSSPQDPVVLELAPLGRDLAFSAARAPFVCVVAISFAVIALVAGPRELDRRRAWSSSVALSALVLATLATDLVVLTVALVALAGVVVSDVADSGAGDGRVRADARIVALVSAVSCVAFALAAVTTGGSRILAPLATHAYASLDRAAVPPLARDAVLVGCAVGIAVFPFSLHLPRVFARASIGPAVASVLVHPLLVVAMHAVLPTLGEPDGSAMTAIAIVATVGAGVAALGAFGRRDVRGMLGYLVASQNGLALAGLATRTTEGGVAAVLSTISTSLATVGLLVLAHALEARAGAVDLDGSHGFAKPWPRLAALYLLLSLALLGFPGTLQFFAEDLLLQGFLATHPPLAYAVLLVAAANGVTILRSYFALFLGPSRTVRADYVPADLGRRGVIGSTVLLGALVSLVAMSPTIGALVER